MKKNEKEYMPESLPRTEELEAELKRILYQKRFGQVLRSTVYILVIVAAVTILISVLFLPVLKIYGTSMSPTFDKGDIVISFKGGSMDTGDIIAFYYNNKILVKRVIANSGDWVNIDENGTVSVNGKKLEETYLTEKALGNCNIELPYQVPDDKVFVMGDHRSTSVDSRNTAVGCVAQEQIVGKITFRIWPLNRLGILH